LRFSNFLFFHKPVRKTLSGWEKEQQGRMVDALALKGDEGRGVAAICFGEVPSNL